MEVTEPLVYNVKAHFYKHKYIYYVLIAVFCVYIIPLTFGYLPKGHDIYFHMTRVDGLAEEMKKGNIPARIYSTIYHDYGYASPLFYGDWLLYIPALIVVCGYSVYTAYKFFIMLCIVLAALSMYFSGKVMFKDKKAACVAALLYSLSTYLGTDALVRHAIGELQSFIFIPIAIAGLYDIIFYEGKRWLLLPLGLCGVIVSHTMTAVITVVFLALFAFMFLFRFFEKPKKLLFILAGAGVFFLLSASFIFPMIEQLGSSKFLATDGYSANKYGSLEDRSMQSVLSLFSVFNSTVKVGKYSYFIPQGVGLVLLVMIDWHAAHFKKVRSSEGIAFMVLALFSLFLTSKLFPWEHLQNELGTLQFPWRIMLFSVVFIALLGGAMAKKLEGTDVLHVFLSIIIGISIFSSLCTIVWKYEGVYTPTKKNYNIYHYENNIGLGEYLPTGSDRGTLRNRGEKIESNAYISKINIERDDNLLTVEFGDITKYSETEEDVYIDLPLIMYKGYKATLETDEGVTELSLSYAENNVIRVNIGDVEEGTIRVWYEGTAIQKASFIITLISFGGVIVYYSLLYYQNNKRRKKQDNDSPELSILKDTKA